MGKRLVILGGGFAGLTLAQNLKDPRFEILLIDKNNYHLFQPLLYQVATGGLSPANIAAPLRAMVRSRLGTKVFLGEAVGFDPHLREIELADGARIPYDSLVVAIGMVNHFFDHPEWEKFAPGLKSLEEATLIRERTLNAFELAEKSTDPKEVDALLTFVVVGGGPTGVEMAGAIAELAHKTLCGEFRNIKPELARIILLEGSPRVLNTFDEKLSEKAVASLLHLGVETWTHARVQHIDGEKVVVKKGEVVETIPTRTVFWGAGVRANPLADKLALATGAAQDRAGRIVVKKDLSLEGFPEIFVLGDLANYSHQEGKPLPGVAPVALQQGHFMARLLKARADGEPDPEFTYHDRGSMATIGRSAAVAQIGRFKFSGFLAWVSWLFIHLMFLVQFQNRALVFFQLGWNYLTFNRSARLITPVGKRKKETG
ncbi:MAG: NAD(P)/FAD-dependent oxidoreductase [Gemmataceae bacterium]|nr:NAD(P)/FAD-dependent oxidoreductase [Gemmataceae bacterium]